MNNKLKKVKAQMVFLQEPKSCHAIIPLEYVADYKIVRYEGLLQLIIDDDYRVEKHPEVIKMSHTFSSDIIKQVIERNEGICYLYINERSDLIKACDSGWTYVPISLTP